MIQSVENDFQGSNYNHSYHNQLTEPEIVLLIGLQSELIFREGTKV